jgi:hypothetical protein
MVIWGTKGVTKVGKTGEFHCPSCGESRTYSHKLVKRYFTLYFIPIFPMEDVGEYVECGSCRGTYKTLVLGYDPVAERQRLQDEYVAHVKRVMVLSALKGGDVSPAERGSIQALYQELSGKPLGDDELGIEVVQARDSGVTPARYARRFAGGLTAAGREKVLRAAALAVRADGELTPEKLDRLSELATALDLTQAHFKGIVLELAESPA